MSTTPYPKRLIEVDLPIARISVHARREKSIRHGHISTLHIWWARRPLAACRAVICAALWPDPVDLSAWLEKGEEVPAGDSVVRPARFLDTAQKCMIDWGKRHLSKVSPESYSTFIKIQQGTTTFDDPAELRRALLDFIADFANWDNSTDKDYLETARKLTQAAHEALGGEKGTRSLVVDPFAGGGSIPLEALRVGADAFASDLNPVPVLLNKVVLEYIPKYGQRLADEVRKWGERIKQEAQKELAEFYPKDPDGATPIAYLWARTIQCEGPGCGAEVPLIRSLWLAKNANRSVALQLVPSPRDKRVNFKIIVKQRGGWADQDDPKTKVADPKFDGTVKRGSATCPCCGYTTPVARVREQLKSWHGGADKAFLLAVVGVRGTEQGRTYRLPKKLDYDAIQKAAAKLQSLRESYKGTLTLVPDEINDEAEMFNNSLPLYGIEIWDHLFTRRQALLLSSLCRRVAALEPKQVGSNTELNLAVQTCLAFAVDKQADYCSSICRWVAGGEFIGSTFSRQALPIVWDFCEVYPLSDSTGGFLGAIRWIASVIDRETKANLPTGQVTQASATSQTLPDDSAHLLATDPPYYYSVQYAGLSDFFYVWLKRSLDGKHGDLLSSLLTPKKQEIVVSSPNQAFASDGKNIDFYVHEMTDALRESRRVVSPSGCAFIVFAQLQTSAWEAFLQSIIDAGWIITGSWPIDTERASRMVAMRQSVLGSSVHLVCRPRENPDGSVRTDEVGDWRDVLAELPRRIHEWMPRLAEEGVVGADAIFACLGPALEIFSRYSRVEKSSGEAVPLREYLEQVWAAVSKEALSMIFKDADTAGLEPDARLTAMWLWTLGGGAPAEAGGEEEPTEAEADDEEGGKAAKTVGFVLEFDAARKIAQGLGIHLEKAPTVVEVKGETARLFSVAERTKHLFGKEGDDDTGKARRKKKEPAQRSLFAELEAVEKSAGTAPSSKVPTPTPGATVLDQVHQAMILFAAGRGEAMKQFLVEDGVGKNAAFWKLAQSLSALYPPGGDEKRWVDGVLARKKGLGL